MRRAAAFVAAGAMALALPAMPARAATPLPPDAILTIPGHGWGHGRGLGQWGSKGMAERGKTFREILTHYYADIAFQDRGNDWLRVLVEASPDVVVTSASPFTVKYWDGETLATSSAPFPTWRVTYSAGDYRVQRRPSGGSTWETVATDPRYVLFVPSDSALELVLGNGSKVLYRGSMTARYASADGMRAINTLRMEDYLRGVVPRESPSGWPAEQLKAQSVAARTYAYRKRDDARSKGTTFDICATTACQVYGGKAGEASSTDAAIAATAGLVMTYSGAPILAEYSSSTGGHTAPGTVAYQRAVPDPGDAVSPHHTWTAKVPVRDVESTWPEIGRLVRIDITERNGFGEWGGRVRSLDLVGTVATVSISGDAFRGAFAWPSRSDGVRSSWFTVGYWAAERVLAPATTSVPAGARQVLTFRFRNRGTEAWPVGGDVTLQTDPGSPFRDGDWIDETTPARISRNLTRPGAEAVREDEVAEFSVALDAASATPGRLSLPLRLVAADAATLDTVTLAVEVTDPWPDLAPTLLANASFEKGLRDWTRTGAIDLGPGRDATGALGFEGSGVASQTVILAGGPDRRFTWGMWTTKSEAGTLSARARVTYRDGSALLKRLPIPSDAHGWTYREQSFATGPSRPVASVTIELEGASVAGRIDALRLVEDPLLNASFERGMLGWAIVEAPEDAPRPREAAWTASDGARSLVLSGRPTPVVVEQRVAVPVPAWDRVRLRFDHRAYQANPDGGPFTAELILEHAEGAPTSRIATLPTATHPWEAAILQLVPKTNVVAIRVRFRATEQTGNLYLDRVRVQRARQRDPSFEDAPTPWSTFALGADDGFTAAAARDGDTGLRLTAPGRPYTTQRFVLRGAATRRLRVGAWASAAGIGSGRAFLAVTFFHRDGSRSTERVLFGSGGFSWRYVEAEVGSTEAFDEVRLAVILEAETGWASVDGISIVDA